MNEADDVGDYRPVSRLAVAAAVLGCLSALTIFSPIFWFIPLLAAVIAVLALRDISQPGLEKVGRLAAVAGLALAIGFGCQAAVTKLVAWRIMASRATSAASAWLAAIREDRVLDARGMMSPSILPGLEHLGTHEDAPSVNDPVRYEAAFRELPVVKAVRGCGKSAADVRCTGYMPDSQESKETWTTSIRLAPCDDGGSRAVALELQPTLRPMAGGRVERWEVTKVELVGPVKTGQ